MEEKKWYVIYTKPRWEKKVTNLLLEKSLIAYCPLNMESRKWSDRLKLIMMPLFPSYVFVNISENEKAIVRETAGVINFVYSEGKPAVVKAFEIDRIKKFIGDFKSVEVLPITFEKDQTVMINQGLFLEKTGRVVDLKNSKVSVFIESLGYTLSAVFDKSTLINH